MKQLKTEGVFSTLQDLVPYRGQVSVLVVGILTMASNQFRIFASVPLSNLLS